MTDEPRDVVPGDVPRDVSDLATDFATAAARVVEIAAVALQPFLATLNVLAKTPPWSEFLRKTATTVREMRRGLFLARWRVLTPRERKDLLRRQRKGMRV